MVTELQPTRAVPGPMLESTLPTTSHTPSPGRGESSGAAQRQSWCTQADTAGAVAVAAVPGQVRRSAERDCRARAGGLPGSLSAPFVLQSRVGAGKARIGVSLPVGVSVTFADGVLGLRSTWLRWRGWASRTCQAALRKRSLRRCAICPAAETMPRVRPTAGPRRLLAWKVVRLRSFALTQHLPGVGGAAATPGRTHEGAAGGRGRSLKFCGCLSAALKNLMAPYRYKATCTHLSALLLISFFSLLRTKLIVFRTVLVRFFRGYL